MCGIVGYIGKRNAYEILVKGLHRLEYRGYDSAGVALLNDRQQLNVYKAKGKVSDLETAAQGKDCKAEVGIAHTRWATHGEPSVRNAHPHVSGSGNLVIVHNGIIENFMLLRDQLVEKGFKFNSDTDTEVLVQLIEYAQQQSQCSLVEAVPKALTRCIGAYAIAVLDRRDPSTLVAARKGSPMVIGIGKDDSEFFIASDATPIVEYTQDVVYVDDEQVAVCQPGKPLQIIDLKNQPVDVDVKQIDMDLDMLDRGGFPHFYAQKRNSTSHSACATVCGAVSSLKTTWATTRNTTLPRAMPIPNVHNDVILSAVRNNRARLLSATPICHRGLWHELARRTHCQAAH